MGTQFLISRPSRWRDLSASQAAAASRRGHLPAQRTGPFLKEQTSAEEGDTEDDHALKFQKEEVPRAALTRSSLILQVRQLMAHSTTAFLLCSHFNE